MIDFDLKAIPQPTEIAEVYYTYSPQQQALRDELIRMIEDQKRAFLERIDPYVKRLANIQGTPHFVINTVPPAMGDSHD